MIMNKDIEQIINSGEYSGYRANKNYMYGGKQIQALEKEWAKYFKVKHAIAVNSATSGLWCALAVYLQLNINERQFGRWPEVIVTPYSMTCSASLPFLFGAKPEFCDIEKDYYCLDPKEIKKHINNHTKGIIVVDLFGMPYEADEINKIAKENGLWVIEDAAQAIGSTYKGKFAGTLGDIGVYSLNQHKHLSAGEGGVIVTNDSKIAFQLRMLLNHAEAISNETNNNIHLVGMNLRMTEITAAIARQQLKNIEKLLKPWKEGAKDFDIPVREGCTSTYYKYAAEPVKNKEKYNTKNGYIKPLYQMPYFRRIGYQQNICSVCEEVEKNIKISWLKD